MTKIPPDDILEGLYKLRIRESEKLKTVLELYDLEIHQKKMGPDYHRLKTMVKKVSSRTYEIIILAPEMEIMEETPWSRIREQNSVYKEFFEIVGNGSPTGSVLEETIAVSATISISVEKLTQSNPSPNSFMQQNERDASRTRSPRGRSPSGKMFQWPCKDYLKGTCTNSFCEKWHPPECLFYKTKSGCRCGEKCSFAHRQVEEQPSKRSKKNGDKSSVSLLKKHEQHHRTERPVKSAYSSKKRQLCCVSLEMEPPKSTSILRKSSDMLEPIRCVKFSECRCTSR